MTLERGVALEEMNKIRQAHREVYPLFRGVSNSVLADRYDMMNVYDSLYNGMNILGLVQMIAISIILHTQFLMSKGVEQFVALRISK